MNMYQKFVVIFISFAFLIWLIFKPLTQLNTSNKYFDLPSDKHELSQVELNDFLGVWSNLMLSSFKDSIPSSSLTTKTSYPHAFVSWLNLQYWSVERFFYTEQKIRDMLKYAEIKTRLEDNKKIAKKSHINLNKMNNDLEERLLSSPYSDEELDLIILNFYQITEILSARAVLGKPQ